MNENTAIKVARIYPLKTDGALKAFVDITINDVVMVRGVRIIDGRNGLFVSMPQVKAKDEKWYETVRCLSNDFKNRVAEDVLNTYASYDPNSGAEVNS
jgi:stage V sporulation protein G